MAELVFTYGTMDCGKSTLVLQLRHTLSAAGITCAILTFGDRAGDVVSSRIGIQAPAIPINSETDLEQLGLELEVAYLLADEAQFATDNQIAALASLVDHYGVEVRCFGLTTDFTGQLFPASKRLVELADRLERLPIEARCWCGSPARANARVVGEIVVREGPQRVLGDTGGAGGSVRYATLCRRHFLGGELSLSGD